MVSEQKVRMMIRLAEYESHEGKQDFARTKYYKMDYIRLQILKTLVCVTCAVVLIAVIAVVVCFRRNSAGSCCQRNCYIEQCSIYIVWAKYRNVYHSTSCICRRKPQCEKDDNRALYI